MSVVLTDNGKVNAVTAAVLKLSGRKDIVIVVTMISNPTALILEQDTVPCTSISLSSIYDQKHHK